MDTLRRQVRRAGWWLGVQRFVAVLGWCYLAAFGAVVAALVARRIWVFELNEAALWGAGLAAGPLVAILWAWLRGAGPLDAAIEIDRRFGLKERVSASLAMNEAERRSPAGQALLDDAVRSASRLDLASEFAVVPRRSLLLPLIPAAAGAAVVLLFSPATVEPIAAADPDEAAQVQTASRALQRRLAERRERAESAELTDAEDFLRRLERGLDDLSAGKLGERRQALARLNDLANEMEARRKQFGGAEQLRQQLNQQMRGLRRGPADELARALGRGDFRRAMEELERLREQLAEGGLDEEARERLADQMEALQERLERLAEAHRRAVEALEKAIAEAERTGREDDLRRLADQLDRLMAQTPQMQQLEDLAEQFGECAQCLGDGMGEAAAAEMAAMLEGLEAMAGTLDELGLLEDAMNDLAQARDQMNCRQCAGMGCGACQEGGDGTGDGIGTGRGFGEGPETEIESAFYDTQVRQRVGPGAAGVVGVEGPNIRGRVEASIREQLDVVTGSDAPDPLTGQTIPRQQREHAREYFDRFREGR